MNFIGNFLFDKPLEDIHHDYLYGFFVYPRVKLNKEQIQFVEDNGAYLKECRVKADLPPNDEFVLFNYNYIWTCFNIKHRNETHLHKDPVFDSYIKTDYRTDFMNNPQNYPVPDGVPSHWFPFELYSKYDLQYDKDTKLKFFIKDYEEFSGDIEESLNYVINKFFIPWGYNINGSVIIQHNPEEPEKFQKLIAKDNKVSLYDTKVKYIEVIR